MKLTSREVLYHYQLKDLVSMENQIENAIESLAEAATNEQLQQGLKDHHAQTQEQLKQVQKLLEKAGKSARGRKCKGIESILLEGEEAANSTGDDTDAKDAAIIAAARSVEHYETAAYLAAADSARALGLDDQARVLREIMNQEAETDRKLASVSQQINPISADQDSAEGSASSSDSPVLQRSSAMNTQYAQHQGNYQGQGSYEGRSEGGRHSAQMQGRDEQGQFTGYQGSHNQGGYNQGGSGDYDYNRGRYQQGGGFEGPSGRHFQSEDSWERMQEGRSRGGYTSSHNQPRDEYGQFMGYGGQGGGQSGERRYSSGGGGNYGGGNYGGGYNQGRGQGDITDSAGRHYTQESWERAQEGRSLGGQHSHGGYGGNYGGQQGNYGNQGNYGSQGGNYGNQGHYGNQGGGYGGNYGGGQGDITDSAGRHYTQESWERAQEGRSRGGQHSHGGGGNYGNQGGGNYR